LAFLNTFEIASRLFVLTLVSFALAGTGCVRYTPRPISLAEALNSFETRSLTNRALQEFISSRLTNEAAAHSIAWSFDALTLAAFYYHPSLPVARAQAEAADAAKLTAGTRPNPTMGLAPGYDFNAISPASPWIPGMTVDFPIETAGKRGKRLLEARYNAEAARLDLLAARWQVRTNLRRALIEVLMASRREELISQQITNQASLIALLRQRISAGEAGRFDIAPYEINRLRLQADLAAARSVSIQARAHLAEALGVPARALEELRFDENILADLNTNLPADAAELRANALQHRADLLSLLARYEAAQAALRLEIAKQYPDVHLGSGYQWDQGESKWTISLNFEIPILNQNRGPIAEAEVRRAAAAAGVFQAQTQIANEIDRAMASLLSAREESDRARDAHAALEQQVRFTRERLAAGGADQVELQTALLDEGAASLTALDSEMRALSAAADLEAELQVSFPYLDPLTMNPP
jgi:outer membrane protein TolC